ncbi:hypothetical protein M758_UG334700 [Ceratodon purpureus]|nr:hypothetical protein M758_UG334700 [Ceratodon purpureus]
MVSRIAIVRGVPDSFYDALSMTPPPQPVDRERARLQHAVYVNVLKDDASDDDMDSNTESTTSMDDEERDGDDMDENDEHCGCSGDLKKKKALPADAKAALASGALVLPYNNHFPVPPVETSWAAHHSLLCTGPSSHCKNTDALVSFKEFADETNDIFYIAAQVIAATMLRARKLELGLESDSQARKL